MLDFLKERGFCPEGGNISEAKRQWSREQGEQSRRGFVKGTPALDAHTDAVRTALFPSQDLMPLGPGQALRTDPARPLLCSLPRC